ncbi:MAG: hypothetical protein ACLSAF_07595 [Intestinimonas sp.]
MRDRRAETWTWWRATTAAISPRGRWSGALRTAALRAGLAGLVHDPDDILPLVDLDAVETDGSGGLRTDLEALLAPIRTAKPYLFRTGRRSRRSWPAPSPRPRRRAPQKLYHGGAGTPHHGGVQRGAEDRRAGG